MVRAEAEFAAEVEVLLADAARIDDAQHAAKARAAAEQVAAEQGRDLERIAGAGDGAELYRAGMTATARSRGGRRLPRSSPRQPRYSDHSREGSLTYGADCHGCVPELAIQLEIEPTEQRQREIGIAWPTTSMAG